MPLILSVALAAAQPLPFIDRAALHALAKFEARPVAAKPARAPRASRRLSDLCLAADAVPPATSDLGRVYSMSAPRVSILRSTCALHQASEAGTRIVRRNDRAETENRPRNAGGLPPSRAR